MRRTEVTQFRPGERLRYVGAAGTLAPADVKPGTTLRVIEVRDGMCVMETEGGNQLAIDAGAAFFEPLP